MQFKVARITGITAMTWFVLVAVCVQTKNGSNWVTGHFQEGLQMLSDCLMISPRMCDHMTKSSRPCSSSIKVVCFNSLRKSLGEKNQPIFLCPMKQNLFCSVS